LKKQSIFLQVILAFILCSTALVKADILEPNPNSNPINPESKKPIKIPRIGGKPNQATKLIPGFTAETYFAPIRDTDDRTGWPKLLTFSPIVPMTIEKLQSILLRTNWKMVYHCGGQAISVNDYMSARFLDGITNWSVTEKYSFNGVYMEIIQTMYPPEFGEHSSAEIEVRTSEIYLKQLKNSQVVATYNKFYSYNEYKVVRLNETGETLIERSEIFESEDSKICPDKTEPKALLVPIKEDLTS
jgi:hypothetical protein